ncbi:sigma-54-dependent transcriptional regulator [Hippea maritima]|uniref:Putative two component, sigma54 specific, transcriptional regulator n=1 Tax=Hippea maritima (strain ATCC 700847 / DSM 10411 / MH2) TaxID=760142 RepID=F2LVY4_HIPMA|nr:sigma-54 dependent transcriptional regulator [Hippea maritima]AEA33918.1 putative two component, sigma54 specific, transcriptional regulator [Hippea maritima DSM 10411]
MYKILVVDDDEQMRVALKATLDHLGYNPTLAKDAKEALKLLKKNEFDFILSDLKMPKMDGVEFLKEVKNIKPHIPFVMITAFGDIKTAVEAMKLGAFDFILKPFSQDALKKIIEMAISHTSIKQSIQKNPTQQKGLDHFVFKSKSMENIITLAQKVAQTDATVLLIGESGTGKEVLARYIHSISSRAKGNFIAVNCAAIPQNLLESEMFGYEKGAFSGAAKSHPGKFEQANRGTILLDEISEMPLELQAKLLRVIQEKTIDRIGSTTPIKVDVRIICTTNRDIEEEVKNGNFREDLYYRISVFPIKIPPLRQRKEEIPELINFFIRKFSNQFNKNVIGIKEDAIEILINYPWPGNIRELQNVIERAVVLTEKNYITKDEIFLHNLG